MEMRACEDIDMGEDITLPIPPIAFSLYDSFLLSHCSACFLPLNSRFPPILPINPINSLPFPQLPSSSSVLYCSPECSKADSDRHFSSAEHHLFLILQSEPTTWHSDTTDLRASLRLLLCFEALGLLSRQNGQRIAGLMSNRDKLVDGEESDGISERIREGGRLMSLARRMRDRDFTGRGEELEKSVLCQVLTNAVEVQVNEGCTLGVAVYGRSFSWINHSCSPNACYRFSFNGSEMNCSGVSGFRVIANGDEAELKTWVSDESNLNNRWCGYGPRIIVRSIKLIKKGEEVCVTYTDLLQPKAMRCSELWLKYRFMCCCKRCSASPQAYVDRILQEDAAVNLKATKISDNGFCHDKAYQELNDFLEEAITEYLSVGDPESSCEKLEKMLIGSLQDEQLQPEEVPSHQNLKLHPLHYLSLRAYIMLASAYKIRASHLPALHSEMGNHHLEAFDMSRTSAAYSLLLAGATHHLFLYETSLIATAANFWINTGESLLNLTRSSTWSLIIGRKLPNSELISLHHRRGSCSFMDKLEISLVHHISQNFSIHAEFEEFSKMFLDYVSRNSPKVWPFLIHGHHYFKHVSDPVDFRWLGMEKACTLGTIGDCQPHVGDIDASSYCRDEGGGGCRCETGEFNDRERIILFQFGAHCLLYGGYLSSICYGSCSSLTYARNLLVGGEI